MFNRITKMQQNYSMSQAWYTLCLLILLYCFSFIDRLILSLLAPEIMQDLGVSDTQMGLLFGLGFGVVYSLIGLPLAHLIDRNKRMPIIAAGVILWSLCTVASAFAPDFTTLLILRAGVAIGEAVLSPAAISIIADIFPRDKRVLPTTLYTAVATVMESGAFIVGGAALMVATSIAPGLGLQAWQLTLVFVGIPGLLLAPLLLLSAPEPRRRGDSPQDEQLMSSRQAFAYVWKERQFYGCLFSVAAFLGMAIFAKVTWTPTLLVRAHGVDAAAAGYWYGILGLVGGISGAAVWPFVTNKWTQSGRRNATVTVFAICATMSWIFIAIIGVATSERMVLFAVLISSFFSAAGAVLVPLLIQAATPGRMRARIMASYLMFVSLVGFAFGPPAAAIIGNHFFTGPSGIGYGMTILTLCVGPVASVAIWSMHKPFLRAQADIEIEEAR